MEGVSLERFNKLKPSTLFMAQFNSRLSDKIEQDDSTTTTHPHIILRFLLFKGLINSLLTTILDHTNVCSDQYHSESLIYLLTWLAF